MTVRTASCACGQLRVTCEGEPDRISICHCLECQKRSGNVFATQARFPSERVAIAGQANQWSRRGGSGQGVLLTDPSLAGLVQRSEPGLRQFVGAAAAVGVAAPAHASALAWLDGMRTARLPADLIQALRDLFGAHRFERIDRAGSFHHDWSDA